MKVCSIFLVLCVCSGALGVYVQVGDKRFPLEAVKQLKELMKNDHDSVEAFCADPLLPLVFRPVCQGKDRIRVFYELVKATTPIDPCEICENPACGGCEK